MRHRSPKTSVANRPPPPPPPYSLAPDSRDQILDRASRGEITPDGAEAEAVRLGLPLPSDVTGIKSEPVVVAADKRSAVLTVVADAKATTGTLANLVIRAQMDFDGKAEVDEPISLRVVP